MCRGHPKHHRCAHTSVAWAYCPSAYLDMDTGATTPCGNPIMNDSQPTKAACPLQHCRFATKSGAGPGPGAGWVCCQCRQGPNRQGWCTQRLTPGQVGIDPRDDASALLQMTCDHGCCESCTGLGSDGRGAKLAGLWTPNYTVYDCASSPSSSSDGANTWVSSPPSSDAGSDRPSTKGSSRAKKRSSKKSSKRS
ncbi:hypothetical protein CCM_08990 [Cordyceps militaris CM01]|uniref:Uncharacterized protein n=1 Tax=Cordyceps militaris (strain CM01) TaxID=983644 RepID=G3JSU7_CORMM|nr:uncharacterized protein CCM_08990 [Cordyceps militaris CM01]EGX88943.1 hypothetical protein CCM_08990 [Cordyceps militaris CM01]